MNKKIKEKILVFSLIIGLIIIYQYKYINEFPSHIHAWAQSDRYALSMGFLNNGLNFFKPEMFIYNHQFPGKWAVPSGTTITAVDFPIHDYIPALLMKISGNCSPWIFRLYILFFSFIGLFYLYKLAKSISGNKFIALFIVLFAATSPVFVYYQGGFLPTIPSLVNAMIGIYYYHFYLKEESKKNFWLAIFFLSFAALSRTTFAIPLIAIVATEFIRFLRKETDAISKILPVFISFAFIIVYLIYNAQLRKNYGSNFLNHILPPENFEQFYEILKAISNRWIFQYFSLTHYLVFLGMIFLFIISIIRKGVNFKNANLNFPLFSIIYFAGSCLFSLLMFRQFSDHDYYFLDTFFLPVILIFIILFSSVAKKLNNRNNLIYSLSIAFASVILIVHPVKTQNERRKVEEWDRTEAIIKDYKNSSEFLDSLNISRSAKMLVLDAVIPNMPFILMERKGYAVMQMDIKHIEEALSWDYDYIIFQNKYFMEGAYKVYPDIISKLEKIADNGKISVCKATKNNKQSINDFLSLIKVKPVFESYMDFENTPDNYWKNVKSLKKKSPPGSFCGYIDSTMEFGLTFKSNDLNFLTAKPHNLKFSSYFLSSSHIDSEIVVSINSGGKNIYYKSHNLKDFVTDKNEWTYAEMIFPLPTIKSKDFELGLYIWNTGKSEFWYDDFGFNIY
jgi:hypothetical protein